MVIMAPTVYPLSIERNRAVGNTLAAPKSPQSATNPAQMLRSLKIKVRTKGSYLERTCAPFDRENYPDPPDFQP